MTNRIVFYRGPLTLIISSSRARQNKLKDVRINRMILIDGFLLRVIRNYRNYKNDVLYAATQHIPLPCIPDFC